MKYKTKQARHRLIARLVGDASPILDIGFAQHPNEYLNNEVYGIDIQKVRKPANYKLILQMNLNKNYLPCYWEDKFNAVIANDIIEHIENPSNLLREINRVLKPNGKLLIGTPNASYYWFTLRNLIFYWVKDSDEGQHLNCWTIIDFTRLLKLNGFKVNKMYGSFVAIPIKYKDEYLSVSSIRFPRLSQLILYDCTKISKPINQVITKQADGYNVDNSKWIRIKQR